MGNITSLTCDNFGSNNYTVTQNGIDYAFKKQKKSFKILAHDFKTQEYYSIYIVCQNIGKIFISLQQYFF